jgi:predicted pyridoxine 5'-phosphate oxidase superfamily flavin-nucleotide-binding protein
VDTLLTSDVQRAAERSVLCWLATVDTAGQPNVTPKELFAVFDEAHVVIANIASPGSAANVAVNPKVCVSFVDVFVQKGFKVLGVATDVAPAEPRFERWVAPLRALAGDRYPIRSVFVVRATAVHAIVAPSYWLFPDETTEASQVRDALRAYGVRPADDPGVRR